MNILKGLITFVPDIIGLVSGKSKKSGKEIANAGKAITAVGAGLLGTSLSIEPGTIDGINLIIINATALIGAITALVGAVGVLLGKSKDNNVSELTDVSNKSEKDD